MYFLYMVLFLFVIVYCNVYLHNMLNDILKVEKSKISGKRAHVSQVRDNNVAIGVTSRTPEGLRRIRGTHGSFAYASEWLGSRQSHNSLAVPLNYNGNSLKSILYFQLYLIIILYIIFVKQLGQSNSFKRRSPSPLYDAPTREKNAWHSQVQT